MIRALAALGLAATLASCTASGDRPGAAASPAQAASTSPTAPSASPAAPATLHVKQLRWRLPQPLAREALVGTDPAHLVVAGGLVGADSSTADAFTLDLLTGRHTALPAMPVPVHDTAGALVGGRGIVVGGGNASEQSVVQARHGNGWRVLGHLPGARSDLTTAVVDGTAYVLGGYDGTVAALPDVLASTDGRHWKVVSTMAVPVRYTATAVLGGQVWMFGGESNHAMLRAVQRFDPATGKDRVVARLPRGLGHACAVPLGSRILLVGGRTGTDTLTDAMWWFDPATKTFTRAGRLPIPLADSAVLVRGNTAWLVGGETPAHSDRVVRLRLR